MNTLTQIESTIQALKKQIQISNNELNELNKKLQEYQQNNNIINLKPEIIDMIQKCNDEGILKRIYKLLDIPEDCPKVGTPCYCICGQWQKYGSNWSRRYNTKGDEQRLIADVKDPEMEFSIIQIYINKYNRYRYNELVFGTYEKALQFAKEFNVPITK